MSFCATELYRLQSCIRRTENVQRNGTPILQSPPEPSVLNATSTLPKRRNGDIGIPKASSLPPSKSLFPMQRLKLVTKRPLLPFASTVRSAVDSRHLQDKSGIRVAIVSRLSEAFPHFEGAFECLWVDCRLLGKPPGTAGDRRAPTNPAQTIKYNRKKLSADIFH